MKIYLAPMEGLADHFLRKIITRVGGYDLAVSEFVRVVDQLLPKSVYYRQIPELQTGGATSNQTPIRVQLLGSNPNALAENAARALELGSHGVDLNFGCPSKTVNNSKGGAALLNEPETLFKILNAVTQSLPKGTITSAKMRLGDENEDLFHECADALKQGGASEITIHARTKAQGYRPPAHWHRAHNLQKKLGIPIIINGEIWTVEDADNAIEAAQCDHLMLGRGAVRQPTLANHIKNRNLGITPWPEIAELVKDFWFSIYTQMPDRYCSGRLKQWLNHLRITYPEAEALFISIRKEINVDSITKKVNEL